MGITESAYFEKLMFEKERSATLLKLTSFIKIFGQRNILPNSYFQNPHNILSSTPKQQTWMYWGELFFKLILSGLRRFIQ